MAFGLSSHGVKSPPIGASPYAKLCWRREWNAQVAHSSNAAPAVRSSRICDGPTIIMLGKIHCKAMLRQSSTGYMHQTEIVRYGGPT